MRFEFKFQLNVLTILLTINIVVFLLAIFFTTFLGFDLNVFYLFGGLIPERVFAGDFWLLLTSAFFHLNIMHFLFNLYALWRTGQIVQDFYGGKVLLLTYVVGALGGSFLSIFFGSSSASLGASGAIFALVGLLLGGSIKRYRYGAPLPFTTLDILPIVILSFLIGLAPGSNINNFAHLGGLLAGFGLGLIIKHSFSGYKSRYEKNLEQGLYAFSATFMIVSFVALILNALRIIFLI